MYRGIIAYFPAAFSFKPDDNSRAGNQVVTGSGDGDGLVTYIIPQFQSQGDVPLQHDICAASVIPGELPTVVSGVFERECVTTGELHRFNRATPRDRRKSASKAIRSDAGRGERLKACPDPQVAHIVEREKIHPRVP